MRIASRIVGCLLALAGLGFLGLSVLLVAHLDPNKTHWIAALVVAAFGVGLLFGGWYFFRLDVDAVDGPAASRFAPFFFAHRRELKLVAQVGLVVSLLRLGAACAGWDWPGRWALWALILLGIALAPASAGQLSWDNAPSWVRSVSNVVQVMSLLLVIGLFWSRWSHSAVIPVSIVRAGLPVVLFAEPLLRLTFGVPATAA